MRDFKKIYVGNLNLETNEDRLREVFSEFGNIEYLSLVVDKETGSSRGFAFITFDRSEDAVYALEEMDGTTLDGYVISVNEAFERKKRNGHNEAKQASANREVYREDALEKALFEAQKALDKAFSLYKDRKSKLFR